MKTSSRRVRIGNEWVMNRRRMGIIEDRWRMGRESATAGVEITLQSVADEGKASPVRTRWSVAGDLETKRGLIGDGEWLIGNGSSTTDQKATIHRWWFIGNVSLVTVQRFRYFFLFGFLFFWPKTPMAERFLFCWVGEFLFLVWDYL